MGRTGRVSRLGLAWASFFLFVLPAAAYTPTLTPGGAPVRWQTHDAGSVKIDLAGNPRNQSGLSERAVFDAVTRSLQRWKAASAGTVDFNYWQGTDSGVYTPSSAYDGLSSLYFASNAQQDPHVGANVLGLTQVWYDTNTGRILETDVVLNDRDFHFTTNPRDTSGYGSGVSPHGNYGAGKPNVFVENVLTHELGHVFGLSHSGGLQSTMLFMESPEQAHLGCDEQVAIHALYPDGGAGQRGAISGTVVNDQGAPVFGAHVVAISRRRGTALATALTDRAGRYEVSALEPGSYFLMVEPFYAGSQTLPSYYAQSRSDFCGGRSFARSMLTDPSGSRLLPISVNAGSRAEAPALFARCAGTGGADIAEDRASTQMYSAPVVFDGASERGGFGSAGRLGYSSTNFYQVKNVSGHIELHAMGYSLYSPVHPTLTLLDSFGTVVLSETSDSVYQGDSGYVNYDSMLVADDLPAGNYIVRVSSSFLDSSLYPAGQISLDSVPFLVVTGSVNESAPALQASLPFNARCRMEENFLAYSSPPGNPPRHSDESSGGVGFCGTVERLGGGPPNGSAGNGAGAPSRPGPAAAVGWLLPFLSIVGIARWLRRLPA